MPASHRVREVEAQRMNYATVLYEVESKLSPGLLHILKNFVLEDPRIEKLWGLQQPNSFATRMVTLTLFKDLCGLGYQAIINKIELGFVLHPKSFAHNAQLIRKILAKWARKHIVNEGVEAWKEHASLFPKKRGLGKVNLILDSSDFRLSGRASMSRKDPRWSYKLNAPGQRFQLICDARGKVQRLWGGYSPKVYDGDWVAVMKEELAREFQGSHIIADTHYETANRTMKRIGKEKKVVFYTPFAKPRGRKPKSKGNLPADQSRGLHVLTKEQISWNNRIAHVRARIESPFGLIKRKWAALGKVFYEDEDQHNYLIMIAVAVHNYQISHSD